MQTQPCSVPSFPLCSSVSPVRVAVVAVAMRVVAKAAEAKVGAVRVVAGTVTAATAVVAKGWGVARAVEVRLAAEKVAVSWAVAARARARGEVEGVTSCSCPWGKTRSMAISIASSVVIRSRMS